MKIKHSKYRNTGLLFELLVKQITSDTLARKESVAIKILKKYFADGTDLSKELRLYEFLQKNKNITSIKAESILSTITEISRKLNYKKLKKEKYNLISEIKDYYNVDNFFSIKIQDYKLFAALYCLLEAQNSDSLVNPQVFIDNKTTIIETLTQSLQDESNMRDTLIEEYSKYDKDLKLLTYKILLEKFNKKYSSLLPEQKEILKEFIVSVSSTTRLRSFVNEHFVSLKSTLSMLSKQVDDEIVKIKLKEIISNIKPLTVKEPVTDSTLTSLLQYYELKKELTSL